MLKLSRKDKMNKINEILNRGVEEVYIKKELEAALKSEKKLRIYYGVDPSGVEIHLGHAICLRKLQYLQQLGHKIIFLIGDFTGMIGDPTDKSAIRQPLTREQVLTNAKTYKEQIKSFLDFSGKNPAEIRFNSEWNDNLTFRNIIELSGRFTVQQLLERDMFQQRLSNNKPIGLHEFLYPLVQGYDAVMLEADLQIGGTDQIFNMLQGRGLMKSLKNKTQMVLAVSLLEGVDGRKMSKSFGNFIAINDLPNEMYGKAMSIKDELIIRYFSLCTELAEKEIEKLQDQLDDGQNPRKIKAKLAYELVRLYHDEPAAKAAELNFDKTFVKKEIPDEIAEILILDKNWPLADLMVYTKIATSKSDAKRLIDQGGVRVDGAVIGDRAEVIRPINGTVIQAGKRKFVRLKLDR